MRKGVDRREALRMMAAAGAAGAVVAAGCSRGSAGEASREAGDSGKKAASQGTATASGDRAILTTDRLGAPPWKTLDPFLFCVHHDDAYPRGNEVMGPAASLRGRRMGYDFEGVDGWRMYHGEVVPGFPQHPHRGFETVTLVRRGLCDHSDSLGAAARFGRGDVQWLTAGGGIQHSEMFPLISRDEPNPLELFQIWLNLPARKKMVPAYFSMLWGDTIPRIESRTGPAGALTEVTMVAGAEGEHRPPAPPPDSWASEADSDVAIWTIRMEPGARWVLPGARKGSNRSLYFFRGSDLEIGGKAVPAGHRVELRADLAVALEAGGAEPGELLMLQGRPIGEPVAAYGPFVMSSEAEIRQAYADYRRTDFGGWPWQRRDPVHAREEGRFARHADGRIERPA